MLFWDIQHCSDDHESWNIPTIIKKSSIAGAGRGRFVSGEEIQENFLVRRLNVITVADFIEKQSSSDCTVHIEDEGELKRIEDFLQDSNPHTLIEEIRLKLSWFLFSDNGKLLIHTRSAYINHSDSLCNVTSECDGSHYIIKSTRPISDDEEIFRNYNEYNYPAFYEEWCHKHNLRSSLRTSIDPAPKVPDT